MGGNGAQRVHGRHVKDDVNGTSPGPKTPRPHRRGVLGRLHRLYDMKREVRIYCRALVVGTDW